MRWTTKKSVEIYVLHSLTDDTDRCSDKIHAHIYTVTVEISASKLNKAGMVVDFGYISQLVKTFDQQNLNDSFEPSTPEMFCQTLFDMFEMEITSGVMTASKMQIESISVCEQHRNNEVIYRR